jgi:hypothetical protein
MKVYLDGLILIDWLIDWMNERKKISRVNYEIWALMGYYAASCVDCLPTFRDSRSVPCSRIFWTSWSLKMGPIHFPETTANNHHTTLHNIPEERKGHQHRGGSMKCRKVNDVFSVKYRINFNIILPSMSALPKWSLLILVFQSKHFPVRVLQMGASLQLHSHF